LNGACNQWVAEQILAVLRALFGQKEEVERVVGRVEYSRSGWRPIGADCAQGKRRVLREEHRNALARTV
jgi:hypothetical protein